MKRRDRWPILTLCGITAAVLIGIAHSAALAMRDTLSSYLACDGDEDIALYPRCDVTISVDPKELMDGFAADGYS